MYALPRPTWHKHNMLQVCAPSLPEALTLAASTIQTKYPGADHISKVEQVYLCCTEGRPYVRALLFVDVKEVNIR